MARILLGVGAFALLIYLGLCVALFGYQRSLIYYPPPATACADVGTLQMPGTRVQVSARAHAGPDALIYFGGNAEDVSRNLPEFAAAFPTHALYLLHYRGYCGSSGQPSEAALVADALALFDLAQARHQRIVLVGRSLGSGIAVRVASLRPAAALVLVTPYDSLLELGAAQFPWLPVRWLMRDKYESWRYAAQVRVPTLLIEAEHDEVIPRASSELLVTRFHPGVASLRVLAGVGHNTVSQSPEYLPLLQAMASGPANSAAD